MSYPSNHILCYYQSGLLLTPINSGLVQLCCGNYSLLLINHHYNYFDISITNYNYSYFYIIIVTYRIVGPNVLRSSISAYTVIPLVRTKYRLAEWLPRSVIEYTYNMMSLIFKCVLFRERE